MKINENIRKIRELKGFSQEFMAQKLNMSQRHYSRLEKEEVKIDMNKITLISEVLEVSPIQIIEFDEKQLFINWESNIDDSPKIQEKEQAVYEKQIEKFEKRIEELELEVKKLKLN